MNKACNKLIATNITIKYMKESTYDSSYPIPCVTYNIVRPDTVQDTPSSFID